MTNAVPQPRNLQLELLIKLLKMTTSSSDGEALLAARKANEHLAKHGWDWDELLRGKVTVMADPFMTLQEPPKRDTTSYAPPQRRQPPPPPRPTPPPPPPRPSPTIQYRANQYGGSCFHCGTYVDPQKGFVSKPQSWGSWQTSCQMDSSCIQDASKRASNYVAPTPPPRSNVKVATGPKVKFGSKGLDDLLNKLQP